MPVTGVSDRSRGVDFANACVRMWGAQEFAVRHSLKEDVVGVSGLAGYFGAGVDSTARDADHTQAVAVFW
jgi:hypothetical protein